LVHFICGALLVISLIIVEYGQLKFDFIEQLVTGTSKVLIQDGHLQIENLRSVRLTVDQLETQLRLNSISKMKDVKWATIEPNGQISFLLKDEIKAVTKQDMDMVNKELKQLKGILNKIIPHIPQPSTDNLQQQNQVNINQPQQIIDKLTNEIAQLKNQLKTEPPVENQDVFKEIDEKSHKNTIPKHLR